MKPRTLFEKIWDRHVVHHDPEGPDIIYIDLHLLHEVSSPQAFEGLRLAGRRVHSPHLTVATMDHSIPTTDRSVPIRDPIAAKQVETLAQNCKEFGIPLFDMNHSYQGIVHVIGPELGLTLPGKTIVCGDSHTATHGAFGALAFGIGTSEVEHVLTTQCLQQLKPKTMQIHVNGRLSDGVTSKDLILAIIAQIGTGGATGTVIEYTGEAIRALTMEERMTVCNMSIEAGARAGMIAPDETTFEYLRNRPFAPKGDAFDRAINEWRGLHTDEGAVYDYRVVIDGATLAPQVSWGTNPGMGMDVTGYVPDPKSCSTEEERAAARRALEYMGLTPGTPITDIPIDRVFIGSCTNSRIEDLRAAAKLLRGKTISSRVKGMVVAGSQQVKLQAEREGLDLIFKEAGLEWREQDAACVSG